MAPSQRDEKVLILFQSSSHQRWVTWGRRRASDCASCIARRECHAIRAPTGPMDRGGDGRDRAHRGVGQQRGASPPSCFRSPPSGGRRGECGTTAPRPPAPAAYRLRPKDTKRGPARPAAAGRRRPSFPAVRLCPSFPTRCGRPSSSAVWLRPSCPPCCHRAPAPPRRLGPPSASGRLGPSAVSSALGRPATPRADDPPAIAPRLPLTAPPYRQEGSDSPDPSCHLRSGPGRHRPG
jgi:hypothetical protein